MESFVKVPGGFIMEQNWGHSFPTAGWLGQMGAKVTVVSSYQFMFCSFLC